MLIDSLDPKSVIAFSCVFSTLLFVAELFRRKQRSPEKTYRNHMINMALIPLRMLKVGPFKRELTLDNALRYATKKTGLSDFGSTGFVEIYKAVQDSEVQKKQRYTNVGYYLKEVPRVLKVKVRGPTFVMGLPRTGTTLLHRLLSLDTRVRAPYLWELLAPVPKKGCNDFDRSKNEIQADFDKDGEYRKNFIKRLMETRKSMGDRAMDHIHEIEYDLPEECIVALSDDIPSLVQYFYSVYMAGDTIEPVIRRHMVDAYRHYKKYLQLLSFQAGEGLEGYGNEEFGTKKVRNWMLKSPLHLYFPEEIAKVFPDATLIWTHRHPISAVPSFCSLLKAFHKTAYEVEGRDDADLGKILYDVTADMLAKAPARLQKCGLPCANVVYNDMISDPIEQVKAIYTQMHWPYTHEYESKMKNYLAENKEKRESVKKKNNNSGKTLHTYSPEEFGLTAQQLSEGKYKEYIERFNIPLSKN